MTLTGSDCQLAEVAVVTSRLSRFVALDGSVVGAQCVVALALVEQRECAAVGVAERFDGVGIVASQILTDSQLDRCRRRAFGLLLELLSGFSQVWELRKIV